MSRGAEVQRDIGLAVQRTELQRYKAHGQGGAEAHWRRGTVAQRRISAESQGSRGADVSDAYQFRGAFAHRCRGGKALRCRVASV